MTRRLTLLQQQITSKKNYIQSSIDYLHFTSMLTPEENNVRIKIRQFVQTQIYPKIHQYYDQAKFPQYIIPKLRWLQIVDYFLKAPYGKSFSSVGSGAIIAQLYRGDPGVGTMIIAHACLAGFSIQRLGSQQQKAKYLPKIRSFEIIAGWALTEDKIGSDSSNLDTTVTKSNDGYIINGTKRWIGNGNRDLVVVWAKNTENKKIEGYIVENSTPGVSHTVIQNKLALRIVQNCNIFYKNVFVAENTKLPKATTFAKGANIVLKHSRIYVCWAAVGLMMGVYDHTIKYALQRKQFGKQIASFQLVQQKIFKIMATFQAALFTVYRISKLSDQNNIQIGQIAMVKAWVTDRARQVAKWGRQIFGGNGIIHENYVMKAVADAEVLYTYQGSYDINVLVAGRQLTGIPAFKK